MTMVEIIARALAQRNVDYNGPKDARTLEQRVSEEWENWIGDARTALLAIRDNVTPGMVEIYNQHDLGVLLRAVACGVQRPLRKSR